MGFGIMAVAVVSLHIWRVNLGLTARLGTDEVTQGKRIATLTLTGFAVLLARLAGKLVQWNRWSVQGRTFPRKRRS